MNKNRIIFFLLIFVPLILTACDPISILKAAGDPIEDGSIKTGLSSEETTYNVGDEITVNYVVNLNSSFYGDSRITASWFKDEENETGCYSSYLDYTVITPTTGSLMKSGIKYEWTLPSSDYNSETKELTFKIPDAGTYKISFHLEVPAISEDDWSGLFDSEMEFTVVE